MFGEAIASGMGLLLGGYNRKKQLEQQEKLQAIQIQGQKEMGKYNQALALDTWNKTNYEAQRRHMEKAGLSVGLMYGSAGQGGSTQTAPGNVSGGTAAPEQTGMGIQLGLAAQMQNAQIELTKAETQKTKIEAEKIAGVDTKKTGQEAKNLEVQSVILQHEEQIKKIAANVQKGTEQEQIEALKKAADKATAEARSAEAKAGVDEATQQDTIQQIKTATIEQQLRIAATKAGIDNTTINTEQMKKAMKVMAAQIELMGNEQAQNWVKLDQADKERWVKEAQLKLNEQGINFQTGRAPSIKQWVDIISPVLGPGAMLLK